MNIASVYQVIYRFRFTFLADNVPNKLGFPFPFNWGRRGPPVLLELPEIFRPFAALMIND